jgi:hypothetical protein
MVKPGQYLGQVLLYGLFFLPLVYLTSQPVYQRQDPTLATLKVAVRHAGEVVGECVAAGGDAYDKLPVNMRRPEVCPRERSPLRLQLRLDEQILLNVTEPASGLHSDGVSSIYRRFTVPAGRYQLSVLMNDDVAVEDHNWQLEQEIELLPAQVTVVSIKGGFQVQ